MFRTGIVEAHCGIFNFVHGFGIHRLVLSFSVTFFAVVLVGLLMQLDVDPRASKRPLRRGRISGPCFARSSGLVILAHFGYAAIQLSNLRLSTSRPVLGVVET